MNHLMRQAARLKRGVCLLLAFVLLLGLVPTAAFAASDESIRLTGCDFTGMSYRSAALGRASIHTMQFDYNGGATGFCGDHGKGMGRSLIGQTWGNKTEITDPTVKLLMAYYYSHTMGIFTDAAKAAGVDTIWDDAYTNYMNAWVQAVIWRYQQGTLNDPVADAAEELMWVFNCLKHESNTSIDDCTSGSSTSFRDMVQYIFDLGTATWGDAEVYHYKFTGKGSSSHSASSVQSVFIGKVTASPGTEPEKYNLTVKKADAKTNIGLAGAAFHIEKVESNLQWDVTTSGREGIAKLDNLTAGTYAITETGAPGGYQIDDPGPEYVVLPNNGQASVTKTFTDTPDTPPSGEIRKVDKDDPTKGLGGAAIAIQGINVNFYGEFTTNASGYLEGVDWENMTYGSYCAWETAAPEGYSLDPSVKTFKIDADNPTVSLVFENDAKVKVQLMKLDESDNPLPGAVFNVFRDGQLIATDQTDIFGSITVNDVEEGLYSFVEVSAPEGYAKLDQPVVAYVNQSDIQGGGIVTVTATDKRLPDLSIEKKDGATGEAIPNTVFELKGVHTGYQQEVATGNDGTVTLTGIPVDYYEVTEKAVPAPYTLSNERTQTVWLGAGEHPSLVFTNLEQPQMTIMKIDAETSSPIAGVVFSVQGIDVDYEADWTTGADGKYTARITPGSYRITEVSVPSPYSLSANNVRTVALAAGAERELVFENLKNPLLNLTKIDALDGTVIPGTVFSVQGVDNSYSGNWTTETDGTVSERIEPGTYRIMEVSVPSPYYLPENEADRVQTVSLRAGDIRSLVFKDYRTPTLTIYKLDAVGGAPVEGAQFHVTYTSNGSASDAPSTYDFGTLYTNADGEIPLHETGVRLYPGEYTVTEVAPPPGFQMRQPTTQTIVINGSESRFLTFYNTPLNAIIVEKYDSVTGQAVPGATFRLRYLSGTSGTDGTVIGTKTTGAGGSAIWTGLEAGTYIVEEISAPSGYSILQSSQTVYLADNGEQSVVTVSFRNAPDGGLLIRKIDARTGLPMAGIEFLVTDSRGAFIGTGNGKFITDANGTIQIGNVTPGTTLVARETRTLPGYILDTTPQTAVVLEGRTTTLEFRNEPKGTIIVYKKDAVTGAVLEGVQFRVTTASGEAVDTADGMLSSNGVYYTDENGQIILDGLNPDTYMVTETATISGYVLDATPHTVVVRAGDTQTLTIGNPPGGELLILKLDKTTRQPLADAQFRVVPANDALLVDNEGLTAANHLYTTDEDGQIRLTNLTPGAYIVTETIAPEGYALDSEPQTVVIRPGRMETVRFYDSALATLQILKRDAVSHQPLTGAEFTVTTADGTRLGDNNGIYTTGEDGTATVTGLQPNSAVIVSEATSPAGYVLNATPQSIIVRSGSVNSLVFNDEPKTTLLVHKYVSGTRNEPLAGVQFKVTNSRGEVQGMNNGIYTTDANGDFMVTGLDPGLTVTVRETKTVDGFVLDGTPQSIQILAGDTQELAFWNQRKGTLIIRKLAGDTGLPLAGAEFHIVNADGRPVDSNNGRTSTNGRYVTDSRGEIVLTDVTGVIVVTETATVDGYAIDPAAMTQTVVVNPEDAQTLTFMNPRLQTLTLTKHVTGTTTPIQGARFLLTDGDGAVIGSTNGEYTTDRNGQIVVENLVPGTTVTAKEIGVPDEYVLDETPHTIRIRSSEAQSLILYNNLKGSLTIRKIDSATGEALPGAQFRVTTATGDAVSGYTGAVGSNGIFTTDHNGEIVLNRLQPGVYTVREVQAPDGYVVDDQPQTVVLTADGSQTVTFADAPKGSLVIIKRDAVTGAPLAGAEFKVTTAAGTLVANNGGRTSSNGIYVTDEAGQITLTKLSPAAYVVTEVKAPAGYHLSAEAQTVEVTADDVQTVRFTDEPLAGLTIRKQDILSGAGLADAVFSVKDTEGREIGEYTTGTDGSVTVTGLIPGTSVVVTETKAPTGYVLNDHPRTVAIQSGAVNSVTFEDQPTATLLIRKVAADSTNAPLAGVSFKVIDGSGANIGPDDGIFTTDNAGEIRIPGLTPGVTVKVREMEAAPGYVLDPVPQDIEMLAGQVQTLTFRDRRQGALVIRKLDSATNQPLAGVTFKIVTATGDFVPDESGRLSSNGLYRTDAAGEIILTGIVGTLVVTETATQPGYVIDEATRSQTVVVGPNDTQTLTFFNAPKQSLTVQKYVTGTTTPLANVEFLVTDSRGTALGAANGVYVTDENGRFVVTDLEPGVTVTVKETSVPDGYVLDGMPKSIAIQSGEAQSLTFYNSPKGTLTLIKRDSLTDQPLAGAVFQVMTAGGQFVANADGQLSSNGLYTSDERGQVILTGLAPGVYVVRETEAPAGYVLDDTPQTVELSTGETQTLTFRNAPTQTLVIQKYVTGTTTPLAGVEFLAVDSFGAVLGPDNGKFVTDEDGRFTVTGLIPGTTVTVKETKTVDGYILDTTEKSIGIRSGGAQSLTFYNAPRGALQIIKRDAVTNQPLAGATFQVLNSKGEYVANHGGRLSGNGLYTTDASGQILLTELEPATLVVRETAAPDGYVLDDTPQTVEISASETWTLTFTNVPTQTVTIRKYAEGTTTPLQGVRFAVTDGGGNPIGAGEYVTNEAGQIVLSGIAPGTTVIAREVKTIRGYSLNGAPQNLIVRTGAENALTFYDSPLSTLIVKKFIAGTDNAPLSGVGFRITDGTGAAVGNTDGTHYTDDAGEIRLENLEPGTTLTIREISTVDGFVLDGTPKTVEIRGSDVHEAVFWNQRQGSLTVRKLDSLTHEALAGAEFKIAYADGRPVDSANGKQSSNGVYTTNANGEITITGITGTIVVTEQKAPAGYSMDPDSRSQTVVVRPDDGQMLTFYNDPDQTLTLQKYAEGTTTPVQDAVFLIKDSGGSPLGSGNGEFTTDRNGQIVVSGLTAGMTVTAQEIRAADGYTLDATPHSIRIRKGDAQTLTVYNTPKRTLTVNKFVEGTTTPIQGVRFQVTDGNGGAVGAGEYVTNGHGQIVIPNLDVGTTVIVREAKTVRGYALNGSPQSITIASGRDNTLTFYDQPLSSLIIHKYASGTDNEPLSGVGFKIVDGSGAAVGNTDGVHYTDRNGDITLTDLEPGKTLVVREVSAVDGFVLDGTPKTVEIRGSDAYELVFWNQRQGNLTVRKLDSVTREPLAGVEFKLAYADGRPVDTANGQLSTNGIYLTDANGEINVTGVTGTIVAVEQKTLPGYTIDPDSRSQTVVVNPGDTQTLTFYNTPKQTLIITKTASDTGNPMEGVTFLVTDVDGTAVGPDNGQYTTDRNGRIVIENLTPGTVITAKETKTVSGYVLDSMPRSIRIREGEAQTLSFFNSPRGSLTVVKLDSLTDEPLAGAEFRITTLAGEPVDANEGRTSSNGIYTTDANGRISLTKLQPGTYRVAEVRAPAGYVLDGAAQTVAVRSNDAQTVTFRNTPKQTLVIQKYAEGTTDPLAGVTFRVSDGGNNPVGSGNGEYVTDRNGQIVLRDLTPGTTIQASEAKTVSGYVLDTTPQSILIQSGDAQTMVFYNRPKGSLTVNKIDSVSGAPLSGAEFRITTAQGLPVDDNEGRTSTNGIYRTDANGQIVLANLQPGVYTVAETKAPSGYVADGTAQIVTVRADDAQSLTFRNVPLQTLVIRKYADGTAKALAGVTFLLTDANGGNIGNGEYVTDANGQIVIDGLEPGMTVVAREVKTAPGYHLNSAPQTIRISVSGESTPLSANSVSGGTGAASNSGNTLTFYDTPLATLIIHKVAENTNAPLAGCEFHVTDGTGRAIGSTDGVFVTDEHGEITIRNLEIGTTVRARETRTLPGYVLDTTAKDIEIQSSDLHEITFRNASSKTLVVQKYVRGTTTPIPGTEFLITDSEGTVLGSENGKFITDEDGRIVIDGLTPETTVTVKETQAADGYVYDGSPKSIAIRSGDAQTLTFYNAPMVGLTINKYESGTDHLIPGVTFLITDGDGRNIGNGEYVTDTNGRIFVDGLEPGQTVIAREVRTVRGYALNGAPQSIILKSDSDNALTFYDDPLSTLVIKKFLSGTDNEPLSGVEFKIVDGSGANVGESDGVFYTNAQGEIVITGLEAGTVIKARETKTVPGFVLDGTPQDIEIHSSDVYELVFWNQRQGGLTVRKLNSATNEPLSGAEFRIVYADGRPVDNNNGQTSSNGIYTTNGNGEINITGITGTVVITEERAPAGFSMDAANRSQTVVVNPAETQTVTFYNAPDQSIVIQKFVKGTTTPIQGVRFLVTDGDGRTVGENSGEFTTDENGRITVTGLKPGTTITAKEIEAAQGYVLDATPKSATIRSGSVQSLTFYNEPCGTLVITKRDAVTDAPLAGATFQVMNSRGEFVANNGGQFTSNGLYTTDDSGQIILTGLNPMTVVVKETEAPNGYSLNDASQTVEILPNDTQTLTFKNVPLQTLVITKYEEGTTKPLAGVTFSVTDGNGAPVGNGTYTTDANGQIVISGLPAGTTVVAREVRTVKGYHLNGVPQTIQIGTTGTSTLNSSSAVSSVTGTGTAGGGGTVGGSGNSMTFYDAPLATLVVRKFIDGTENEPLPGVEFRIVDGSGKNLGDSDGVFYTDAQGEIVVENLEIGMTVKVRETKTVDGFVLDGTPKDIEISSSDLHELVFWNQRQGGLTVRVRDSVTRETLAGVTFRITYADGRPVDDNNGQTSSNGIYTTDASGEINITGLTGTVVVTEQQTIDGYTMNPAGTTQTVVVNPSETQTLEFFDNPNQTLTIQVLASDTNEPLPGIRFLITDSEGTVVGPSNGEYVADQNGWITITNLVPGVTVTVKETESVSGYILNTQPQSIVIRQGEAQSLTFYNDPKGSLTLRLIDAVTEQFLTGGEFRITTAQGEPVDANEGRTSSNGIYRVDEEGRITVIGLLPGVYTITQTKAPDGYVMAEEPQTVTIHADDAQTLTFRNTPLQTLIVQNYVAGTTTPLVRFEFLVTDGDGTVLGTENGVYRTDENGRFVVSGLRPGINVHVKQTAVTDGYLLNGNPQTIEIRSGEAQTLTFYNEPCGALVLLARDSLTDQPIHGVVFQVINSRGEYVGDYGGELTSNGLYTSDEHGQVIIHSLEPATLVVREVEAPGGYVLNTDSQTVEINPADTQTLTFKNVPTQTVVVQKFVQGTTEPLAGVRFLITDGSGKNLGSGEYVTDENGRIVLSDIAPGTTVIAREIRTVNGYTLNGSPKTLEVVSRRENVLTFYDEPLSTLIIHCYLDGTENEPLANVGFKVVDGSGKSIGPDDGVYYTDHAGNITLTDLEPGVTINARVFKIPAGFVLDGLPQDIVMESGAVQELTFWAKRQGSLTVKVLDKLTQEPVPGVEFSVKYADGRPVDTANGQQSSGGQYFTDTNGEFSVTGVTGTIVITEEQTVRGYTMDANNRSKTVEVNPAETQTLTFFDTPAQALKVQLYARGTASPIPGARFLVTDGAGTRLGDENGEFVTDENGRFSLSGLTPGVTVSVKQISTADGWLMDGSPKTITIRSGNAQSLTFFNDPTQTLTVRLYVKDTTTPIPGAKFLLRDSDGSLIGTNNGEFTTDRNGEFTIKGLTPGVTITGTQTATISGYVLDSAPQSILIRSGEAQTLTYYNPVKGMLTVRKLDAATDEPLQGAEFKITTVQGVPVDDNEGRTSSNGLYTTDARGEIVIEKLLPGTYTVTEMKAPNGYTLDRTPQTVVVNENDSQTLTFRDTALQSLTIVKYEDGTTKPLAGVTFSVTDGNGAPIGSGTYITNANGQITVNGLAPGQTVVVRETRTVRGYVLNGEPQTIVIGNGGNAVTSGAAVSENGTAGTVTGTATGGNSLVFYDEPLSALVIRKYVEGTDNEPLAGIEFSVTDGRGATVGNGTYYTDANGEIRVENLQPGMTVNVRETKTVSGYVLDGTPKTGTIPGGDVLEMVFWNGKAGSLLILKQDSETRQPLPGVEFSVHYADGTPVADENGQISSEGQYFTDENGEIRIDGVVGTIVVTEENTIPGYTIDPNARTKTVTVEANDTQTLTFFNSPKQTLVLQKYATGTTNPIAGAAFYVTDSRGTALGQDGGEFVTDVNGRIILSDLTPGITVTAREMRAASGYALDTTPKSIAIQSGSVQTLTFFNDPVQTVTIRKYVQGTTTPIPGVTFVITDGTGAAIGSGEYTTNDNGEIVLNNIVPGTVINAREVRTAAGYVLNGNPQTLTVRNGESNVLTFYDEPLTTLVIRKYVEGSDNQPIPGTEFKVTDGSGAVIGPDHGIYRTDSQGEIRIPNLEPGQTVTARETKAADGFVLDGTPQTIQIKSGEAQSLTFWNAPTQTLTIHKLVEGTTTPIPGTAFYITDQNAKPLGTANGEFITDADGKIVLPGLTPGDSITAVETRAADGYVLDATPKSIVIRSGEAQTLNFYNKSLGTLIIVKRDKATNAPLKGAEFQVMTADGQFVANAGGQLSSNGIYTTDDKGQIIITDLNADTLVVKETKAPAGYLLNDQPQTVKVGPNDTQTLTFYNQPEKTVTVQKFVTGTTDPIQGVTFLITDSTGATVGPDQGEYTTDRNGRIVLTGLMPGTAITAKEIRTADGFVLDTTPQSLLVKEGAAQTLTFFNQRDGGLELIKTDAADRTKRLPNTTFEIRSMNGGLVKKITTGRDGRIYTSLDAGDYYLVEVEAAEGYKVDPTPEYFTVRDGKTTTLTITNVAQSGILLHKTNASTGQPLYGVSFLLYDSRNNPIGQYTTDNLGYIRILDLEAGQYFLRELENKGFVPDTQMKTVYVKSGETTLVEWRNIPITAQIQITKKSADYNPTNGLPAGTLLEGAVFEIYDKAGNVVDTVKTDSRGIANSRPLPLDRYTFREVTAPANYGVNENEFTAYLEHEGQIVRFEVTDKSLVTGVSINKTGPKEAMPGQPVNYRFDHIGNTSNVRLDSFYWRDTIPAQVRLQKVVTGTYNFPGSYKITYRVNDSEPRTLADNLSTSRNYTLDASPTALGLASNERVTEIMFVFGQAPAGFAQVEAPALYCTLISNVLANSFANVADVGGVYNGQWVQGVTRWTTSVYRKPVKLPRTGY